MTKNLVYNSLLKVTILSSLSKSKLEMLSHSVVLEHFHDKKEIITQGEQGSKFYIIKSGKIDIVINKQIVRTLNELEYFGERALFFKEPRSATAIANGDVELYSLDQNTFQMILDDGLKNYILKTLSLHDNTVKVEDMLFIKELSYGKDEDYILVKLDKKNTNTEYSVKIIKKNDTVDPIIQNRLSMEKSILSQINHPFMVKFAKTIKTENVLLFLMEYVRGISLREFINQNISSKPSTSIVQLYTASILLAVEYLHQQKIIHRDINSEMIIISESVS